MEIDKLHIAEADFDFFLTLNDKEKIGFLYDANEIGLEPTITKYISKRAHDTKPPENRLNDLFQDTYAKKIDGIDTLKYYRCYEIIGSGDPFCPN